MATFPYENTTADRFQEFCQALFLPEYPRLQCLPVGQKDGGRDGLRETPQEQTVLQVKWKRHDEQVDDTGDWMIKALELELPKVLSLIEAGATEYVMVTNARGTAGLKTGSIARVKSWMRENLPIASVCFWRDSLDRRLEASPTLQWQYPEILSGPAALKLALQSVLKGDARKRTRAIEAYVLKQHDLEHEVRFKQVQLKNDLFPLFIDVPMTLQARGKPTKMRNELLESFLLSRSSRTSRLHYARRTYISGGAGPLQHEYSVGAVALLAQCQLPEFRKVVVEGAPGQGKSTLGQYLCELHRAKFLGLTQSLTDLPQNHAMSSARLPFKIDLRDLSAWLEGRNPFPAPDGTVSDTLPEGLAADFDTFLSYQVARLSRSPSFGVDELRDTFESCPILLFFDGFDEVAGVAARKRLVAEVTDALSRLEHWGVDLQAVVTSRPAAFANSPGFSPGKFAYFTLNDVPRDLVFAYGEKWISAKGLTERDASEVRSVLRDRIDAPHIKDLARNPMQLAILLALIHEEGQSLPDKRTDLYEQYLDKFMTRESDKTPVVKSRRRLILQLHGHLAWLLHCNSEQGGAGSLTYDDLRHEITRYLIENGHRTDVLDDIFNGVVERVGALVQRIEGLYEFEVQPLREYFAASHLYQTAPQSKRGARRSGTISDRFVALCQNRFWTNVARFYAGFYKSAELADLVVHLKTMLNRPKSVSPIYARQLSIMLLQDWVFEERPPVRDDLASAVLDTLAIRGLGNNFAERRVLYPSVGTTKGIPLDCGGDILGRKIISLLTASDFWTPFNNELAAVLHTLAEGGAADALLDLAKTSAGSVPERIALFAENARLVKPDSVSDWLDAAARDGAPSLEVFLRIHGSSEAALQRAWADKSLRAEYLRSAIERPDLAVAASGLDGWFSLLLSALATGDMFPFSRRAGARLREQQPPQELLDSWPELASLWAATSRLLEVNTSSDRINSCEMFLGALAAIVGPNTWAVARTAVSFSRVRRAPGRPKGVALFDPEATFMERLFGARLMRRNPAWWLEQSTYIHTPIDVMFWSSMMLTWYSGPASPELIDRANSLLEGLTEEEYALLAENRAFVARSRRSGTLDLRGATPRLEALTLRSLNYTAAPGVADSVADRMIQRREFTESLSKNPTKAMWPSILKAISSQYVRGLLPFVGLAERSELTSEMPVKSAIDVLKRPERFPYQVLVLADASLSKDRNVLGVGAIAQRDGWTFGDPQD